MATPLARRTSREHEPETSRILLLPVGSFEQHGPHLPLATDTLIATTICEDVARICDVDVDVAPAVAFSASGEHEGFAGLLSIGTSVTASVLTELVRSARASWSAVVVVSGHGGTVAAWELVARTAAADGDRVVAWFPTDAAGDPHAGRSETSFMLASHPDLVRMDLAPVAVDIEDGWWREVRDGGVRAVSASGVLGAPRDADAAYGAVLRRRWCAEVVSMIDALQGEQ